MKLPDYAEIGERARLIPVVADTSREQRAVSVLLGALRAVYEFRQVMFASVGHRVAARARIGAWTEVVLKCEQDMLKQDRPDGLVQLVSGSKRWSALIEAKIGNAEIGEEQLKRYLSQAKKNKLDAVITITNQLVALPSHHPIKLPKTITKGVELYHWSWMHIVTQATLLLDSGEITSPDQHFILEEVLRYFDHGSSGINRYDSMNREWKDVVAKIRSRAVLGKTSEEVENTVSSWHQEQRDLCLDMSRVLGRHVKQKISKVHRSDPIQRVKDDCEILAREHKLLCCLEVPDAAADLNIVVDLAHRTIICSMRLSAPRDRLRSSARVNWLLRQISKAAPEGIHVTALRPGRAEETQKPLATLLADASALDTPSNNIVPSGFEVLYLVDLGARFSGPKVFIEELEKAVPHFYQEVGQRLRAWVAPAPKLSKYDSDEASMTEDNEAVD